MSRDPVDRVLTHNMNQKEKPRADDPIFGTKNDVESTPVASRYSPNDIFDEDFGRPATGDGE